MPSIISRYRIVDLTCIALIIGLGLAVALPRYRTGIDWGDEGFLAYGAVRVMEGQTPNRDFVSLQPPLSFYFVAAVFKSLGTSLVSLRIFGLAIYLSIALLLYGIARRFLQPALSLAAAVPAMFFGIPMFNFVPFAVWQGICATLLSVWLFLGAVSGGRSSLAVLAGVVTTLSICLRQDQGLYLALSIVVLVTGLWFSRHDGAGASRLQRILVFWIIGVVFSAVGLVIWWWMQGALPAMFEQLAVFPLTKYGKTSALPFPRFSAQLLAYENALTGLFYFSPVVFGAAGLWLARRIVSRTFSRESAILAFLLVWSALYYCQVLTRSDLNHLLITLPPFFLLMAFCWQLVLRGLKTNTIAKLSTSILVLAAGSVFVWTVHSLVLPDTEKSNELIDVNRGGVKIEGGSWISDFVRDVQNRTPPDRSILVLPYQPMFYFLCERHNPVRWNYIWRGDQTSAEHEEFIAQSKKDPPAMVLVTGEDDVNLYAKPILDYVHQEFEPAGDLGRMRVYLPRGSTR